MLEPRHYYLVHSAAHPYGPWVGTENNTMLAPGKTTPDAVADPTAPHKVLRCVLEPGDQA